MTSSYEKVTEALKRCTAWGGLHECQPPVGDNCPYDDEANCRYWLMVDALKLIREQKKVIDAYHKADSFLAVHGWKWR